MTGVLFEVHEKTEAKMMTVDGWDVPEVFSSLEGEYAAARGAAVIYDSSPLGRLRLTGKTRVDFLHRMSTNELNALKTGQGAATVLTTPIARIVDRVIVYVREDDVLLLTSRGAQAKVTNWLKKHIFYKDDVQVRDASTEFAMISIYGVKAAHAASQVARQDVSGLELHAWRPVGDAVMIARADPIAGDGFHVIAAPDVLPSLWQAAIDGGAEPIGERAFEMLRIESGLPRYPHELSEDYIPLEVGLWSDVSFTKGCYTGQEIIARMESRSRLAKQIVGLRSIAPIEAGADLRFDGSVVGKVTSAARRPAGSAIALAVVKPAHASPGTRLTAGEMEAEVAALPLGKD